MGISRLANRYQIVIYHLAIGQRGWSATHLACYLVEVCKYFLNQHQTYRIVDRIPAVL